ncbi:MAG: hypothetical protein JKX84_07935 [Flavobacteriales bacterium]|nr:hypothetical protein [Flavobacteriales bacterium]
MISLFIFWFGFSLMFGGLGIKIPFLWPPSENSGAAEKEIAISVVAFGFFFVLSALYIVRNVSMRWCTVVMNKSGLTLSKPMLWRKKRLPGMKLKAFLHHRSALIILGVDR